MRIRKDDYEIQEVESVWLSPYDPDTTEYGIYIWVDYLDGNTECVGEFIDTFGSFPEMEEYAVSLIDDAMETGFFDLRNENIYLIK